MSADAAARSAEGGEHCRRPSEVSPTKTTRTKTRSRHLCKKWLKADVSGKDERCPDTHHLRTLSMAFMTLLMSSLARLRVSALTDRDSISTKVTLCNQMLSLVPFPAGENRRIMAQVPGCSQGSPRAACAPRDKIDREISRGITFAKPRLLWRCVAESVRI